MDSDPINESPVKRQRTQNGYRSIQRPGSQSGTQYNTIPTQPLQRSQYDTIPTQPLSRGAPDMTFSRLMSELTGPPPSSPYVTQPTQPLGNSRKSSTPAVQVERSSPPPVPSSPDPYLPRIPVVAPSQQSQLKRPGVGSRLAPAGTTFRRPQGTQPPPARITIDLDDSEDDDLDPPVHHSESDDESQAMRSMIKPTEFTKGGRGLDSSPNRVQESPRKSAGVFKDTISRFAFTGPTPQPQQRSGGGDMAGAYGSVSRNKPVARQSGPSRAQAVRPDKSLDDIFDFSVRRKVERMLSILPGRSISELEEALAKKKGNYDDAVDFLLQDEDELQMVVDLTSSDMETGASKPAAGPLKPSAKQQVKAPVRSIQEKYSSTQAKASTASNNAPADEPVKRKRLMQGRKNPTSPIGSPSPQKPALAKPVSKRGPIVLDDSDSDLNMDSGMGDSEAEDVQSDFDSRLLNFFNTCSIQELADLSNEKQNIAEFILSKRPFRNLDAISSISNAQPNNKSGKRSARKLVGEKILDICTEMWQGYEAVDELVEKCDRIGKPITEAMKQWGIDVAAAARDGELALTKLEDSHDSGIGTPSSSILDDDDIKPAKAKSGKTRFLKQPANMSTDLMMKDYQLFGLNWLNLLWSQKLSCILADDMGLGKTCQVISFLAHLKETGVEGTHLVVVPGSTLENWIRELNRFCPALEVAPYYGSQKEREDQRYEYEERLAEIDVMVTTYETAVSKYDLDFLRKVVTPTVCVFDEGHALKNHQSKRHQSLMRIPAKFRLLLTGTPLQNNLQELVSLLAFILPDIFNDSKREDLDSIFKYKATTKDDDHAALLSAQRIRRARSMMTPFILRRKKQQVLRHMPAKHRRVEYCEMAPAQRELYEQMVTKAIEARAEVTAKSKNSAQATQHMTRLRQAALHPLLLQRLYTDKEIHKLQKALQNSHEFGENRPDQIMKFIKEDLKGGDFGLHRFCLERSEYLSRFTLKNEEWMDSGKVHKLQTLLEAYVKNGDKVLIFSQFTTMMDILEAVLETLSIKFMRLDGSTQMATRQDIIDQFSTDASIPVFMLSTKAGGAGINLACANKVIIFDSSFNPQDDIQAENRAHRVGQTREVDVVRLVTRGTIEEQIHALGESKLALDERVAGAGGGDAGAEKKADAEGEKMVQDMFFSHLQKEKEGAKDVGDAVALGIDGDGLPSGEGKDLKDQFRDGLRDAGLDVKGE
ncbi:hypothetical protein MBLNU459_g1765t1 [Dothideomycetes sp. NU459]